MSQWKKEIGEQLSVFGEAVYGTRGGPFVNDKTGGMTYRGNILYVHVWDWMENAITLPQLHVNIVSVSSLTVKELKNAHRILVTSVMS